MQRKAWVLIILTVAVGAILAGLWSREDEADSAATVRSPHERARASHASSWASGERQAPRPDHQGAAGPLAQIPRRTAEPSQPLGPETDPGSDPELPASAHDTEHTSGWQLGQARRRLSILDSHIDRYEGIVRDLEARGQNELAERQRAVVERFERDRQSLREDELELMARARADGTLGDEEQGFQEGEADGQGERPIIQASEPAVIR